MKQMMKTLREEPAHLLSLICREYQHSGRPVPDHRLHLAGYMSETALRALLAAGMVKRSSGGGLALYTYEPTADGIAQCEKLKGDAGEAQAASDGPAGPPAERGASG